LKVKSPSKPVLYPPVVIAHVVRDLRDLYASKVVGKNSIEIHYSVQLNGYPHMGTLMSLATAFAVGKNFSLNFGIPAKVKLLALENAPAQIKQINGLQYCKTQANTLVRDKPKSEIYMSSIKKLLDFFQTQSEICFNIEYYKEFQANTFVRKILLEIISRQEEFIPHIAPSEKYLRIRFPCPYCGYMEKTAKLTKIVEKRNKFDITLSSHCFAHGDYSIRISSTNNEYVDFNTPLRSVTKEARLVEDARRTNAFNLMVDGGDWLGMSYLTP